MLSYSEMVSDRLEGVFFCKEQITREEGGRERERVRVGGSLPVQFVCLYASRN